MPRAGLPGIARCRTPLICGPRPGDPAVPYRRHRRTGFGRLLLLVAVIDEVIYRLDADGEIPVWVQARPAAGGGITVSFALVSVAAAEITGAAPKAASLSELRCAPDAAGGWSCAVTVDV